MPEVKVQSENVILVEGDASEFHLGTNLTEAMHGFAVMVPNDEGGERFWIWFGGL